MIRILLVDDQNILRQGIQALLEPIPKIQVVGIAKDGDSAIEQVGTLMPDIVIMDIEMPGMNGITATSKICQQFPKTKVLILSGHENQEHVIQALQVGAEGYLLKSTLAEELEQAICSVHQGHSQIESKLLKKVFAKNATLFSQPNTLAEQNGSTKIEKKLLQETSSKSDNNGRKVPDKNYKHLPKDKESTEINSNGSPSKNSKANFKPASERLEFEAKKPLDYSEKTLNKKKSPNKQVRKDPSILEDLAKREQKPQPQEKKSFKFLKWWARGLITTLILLITAIVLVRFLNRSQPQPISDSKLVNAKLPKAKKVAAIGRIEPQGKVISLSAPTSLEAVQVEQLLVKIGDRIKKGQIIAILDGRKRQQAELNEAKTRAVVAAARLEKVQAGATQGAIGTRQAEVANIEAELAGEMQTLKANISRQTAKLDNARTKFQRNQQLYDEGAISTSELDTNRLNFKITEEELNEAKAEGERIQRTLDAQLAGAQSKLEEIKEVSSIDIRIAQAELKLAQAGIARAQADIELAYVRAPVNGEILDIHTRPGEALDEKGIVEIGQTEQMMVVAEIDQNDINQLKIGQKAVITSGIFSNELHGQINQVGSLISKNDILDTDPAASEDSRVIEVEILLESEDSKKVAKLTNLEVDVVIEL